MAHDVYRIRTSRPVLWRTPSSVQVGVDEPALVVDNIPDQAAPLIHALQSGVSSVGFSLLAQQLRVPLMTAKALIEDLSPAFEKDTTPRLPRLIVTGHSITRRIVAETLFGWGYPTTLATRPRPGHSTAIHLLVSDYLIDPEWLPIYGSGRSRHVPLVFSDRSITAGPLVVPGKTPCLSCRELHIREVEPHWLSLGSQLWGEQPPTATEPLSRLSAVLVALVTGHFTLRNADNSSHYPVARYSMDTGRVEVTDAAFHVECRCRGL